MRRVSALDHCYPTSFVSNNDGIYERLKVLSSKTLLSSAHGFSKNIPSGYRTKTRLVKLIMDDFSRHTKELIQLSTEGLHNSMSPLANCLKLQLPLVCHLVHKRYGPEVAPHLLCDSTRWNPPPVGGRWRNSPFSELAEGTD